MDVSIKSKIKKAALFLAVFVFVFSNITAGYALSTGESKVQSLIENYGYKVMPKIVNAPVNKKFTVRFNRDISNTTSNLQKIELIDKVTGSNVSVHCAPLNSREVQVSPTQDLTYGCSYYLIVNKDIRASDGATAAKQGAIAEVIVGDIYNSFIVNDVNYTSETTLEIRFNQALDSTTALNRGYYTVGGKNPDSIALNETGCGVILTMGIPVPKSNNEYSVVISKYIQNSEKKNLGADYAFKLNVINAAAFSNDYKGTSISGTSIISDSTVIQNVIINGDVYISGNNATLRNVNVYGTVFVNPGAAGSASLIDVSTPDIEILSGKDGTINLEDIVTDAVNIYSSSKIRVKAKGINNIYKTSVKFKNSMVILDSESASNPGGTAFGKIEVSADSLKKNTLQLEGDFKNLEVKGSASIVLEGGTVDSLSVRAEGSDINVGSGSVIKTLTKNGLTVPVGGPGTVENEIPGTVPEIMPILKSASVSSDGKVINITFDRNIVNNTGSIDLLKRNISISSDGNSYYPLALDDSISLNGASISITLANPIRGNNNRVKIKADSIKDMQNNVATLDITTDRITSPLGAITAALGGAVSVSENDIKTGGKAITVTLAYGTWAADIASDSTKRDALLDGLAASGTEASQWTKVKAALKTNAATALARTSDTVLTITLPAVSDYDIEQGQTVSLTIPQSAVTGAAAPITASSSIQITAVPVLSAALGGTITASTVEGDIVNGGKTITATLTNCTWAADIASDSVKRNALFDGLKAGSEEAEWTEVITALKGAASSPVVRDSDTKITITLPAVTGYNIGANQTITLTIPAAAITGGAVPLTAAPTVQIAAASTAPAAVLSGDALTQELREVDIAAGGRKIVITLSNATWKLDIATDPVKANELFNGFTAAGSEAAEWGKVITEMKAKLPSDIINRDSDTQITITLPGTSLYNISASQSVSFSIPANAVVGASGSIAATPSVQIVPSTAPSASITGTIMSGTSEADIKAGGKTLAITLMNATWASDIADGTGKTKRDALFDSMAGNGGANGWSKVISTLKAQVASPVARNSDSIITITLPVVGEYDITANERVNITVPAIAMTGASSSIAAVPAVNVASVPTLTLSGTIKTGTTATETNILAGGRTIELTLVDGIWAADIVSNAQKRNGVFEGLDTTDEADMWDKVVEALKAAVPSSVISRVSPTVLTITLPPVSGYNISAPQTVKANIPAIAIEGGATTVSENIGFIVQPGASAALSGTAADPNLKEADIKAGGRTIIVTLTGADWATDIATNATKRNALYDAFISDNQSTEWKKVIDTLKAGGASNIVRDSGDKIITITLPAVGLYDILSNQKITLTIPTAAMQNALVSIPADGAITAASEVAATITGTAAAGISEADIVKGGKTIIVSLSGGVWDTQIASLQAKRELLFNGLTAAGGTDTERDKVINALKTAVNPINRDSDTQITITLPAIDGAAKYDIADNQTFSLTISKDLIVGAISDVGPKAVMTVSKLATAVMTGDVTASPVSETDIVTGGKKVIITLTDGNWVTDIATNKTIRDALYNGFSAATETGEWGKVTAAMIADGAGAIAYNSASPAVVTISIPAASNYNILQPQTVKLVIPQSAIIGSSAAVEASNTFTIGLQATAALSGTMLEGPVNESDVKAGGKTIIIKLTDGSFVSDIVDTPANRQSLLDGLIPDCEATDWSAVKTAILNASASDATVMVRNSGSQVTIKLPEVSGYDIEMNQLISVKIPKALVVGASIDIEAPQKISIISNAIATLGGTVMTTAVNEGDIVSGGKTIIINLAGGVWDANIRMDTEKREALFDGFSAIGGEGIEWAKVITALKSGGPAYIVRDSDTMITITLPLVNGYNIGANQTITLTIPSTAIQGGVDPILSNDVFIINMTP